MKNGSFLGIAACALFSSVAYANSAPTILEGERAYYYTNQGETELFVLNASDDNTGLSWYVHRAPHSGQIVKRLQIEGKVAYEYIPDSDKSGRDGFTIGVQDSHGVQDTIQVSIGITPTICLQGSHSSKVGLTVMQAPPTMVIGELFELNTSHFTPVCGERKAYAPGETEPSMRYLDLLGYETEFDVRGDNGQELIFDLYGSSPGFDMSLVASCGSFYAYDSGDKWVISKRQATITPCSRMKLKYSTFRGEVDAINMNILIANAY